MCKKSVSKRILNNCSSLVLSNRSLLLFSFHILFYLPYSIYVPLFDLPSHTFSYFFCFIITRNIKTKETINVTSIFDTEKFIVLEIRNRLRCVCWQVDNPDVHSPVVGGRRHDKVLPTKQRERILVRQKKWIIDGGSQQCVSSALPIKSIFRVNVKVTRDPDNLNNQRKKKAKEQRLRTNWGQRVYVYSSRPFDGIYPRFINRYTVWIKIHYRENA